VIDLMSALKDSLKSNKKDAPKDSNVARSGSQNKRARRRFAEFKACAKPPP